MLATEFAALAFVAFRFDPKLMMLAPHPTCHRCAPKIVYVPR